MEIVKNIKKIEKEELLRVYNSLVGKQVSVLGMSKVRIISKIYEVYQDYNNIISLCTLRELRFLEMCVGEEVFKSVKGYDFEIRNLLKKFLIVVDHDVFVVPDEIVSCVRLALENYNVESVKSLDRVNEMLVTFVKIHGFKESYTVINACNVVLNLSEDELLNHVFNNLCFKFYADLIKRNIPKMNENLWFFVYRDYENLIDDLEIEKNSRNVLNMSAPSYESFKSIFYNDFDINKCRVKRLFDVLGSVGNHVYVVDEILRCVLLDDDREKVKGLVKGKFDLEILESGMNDMPSGALNGLSLREYLKFKEEKFRKDYVKSQSYIKQENAFLSFEDAMLFSKLYYAILEFTNVQFKIKPMYNIFGRSNYDGMDLSLISETFWKYKDQIIDEFCMVNPFKFSEDELELICEFKRGVRDIFVIVEFLEDFTALMSSNKVYMVKSIYKNLDEIISYRDLPIFVYATVVPFKGNIVLDGVLVQIEIAAGDGFEEMIWSFYKNLEKYYKM